MSNKKVVLVSIIVFILCAMIGFYFPRSANHKNISTTTMQEDIDWCKICTEQEPLYYKFCMVEIGNGNIKMPDNITWTPSEFCSTMANFEKQICLIKDCK